MSVISSYKRLAKINRVMVWVGIIGAAASLLGVPDWFLSKNDTSSLPVPVPVSKEEVPQPPKQEPRETPPDGTRKEMEISLTPVDLTSQEATKRVEDSIQKENFDDALIYTRLLRTREDRDSVRKRIFDKLINLKRLDDAKNIIDQFESGSKRDEANRRYGLEFIKQ